MTRTVQVHAHPPERRRSRPVVLGCGCCCCSCCCLHVVGGVVGAAIGSLICAEPTPPMKSSEPIYTRNVDVRRAGMKLSPTGLYWMFFAGGALTMCLTGAVSGRGGEVGIWATLLSVPAVQLGASLLTAVVVAGCYPGNKLRALASVGVITLMSVLGMVSGALLMMLLCGFTPPLFFR